MLGVKTTYDEVDKDFAHRFRIVVNYEGRRHDRTGRVNIITLIVTGDLRAVIRAAFLRLCH